MNAAVATEKSAAANTVLDLRVLGETLCKIPLSAESETEAIEQLLSNASLLTSAKSAAYFPTDKSGRILEGAVVEKNIDSDDFRQQVWRLSTLSIGERSVQTARLAEDGNKFAVCVPVIRPRYPVEALAIVMTATEPARILPGVVQILQLVAAFAAQWRGRVGSVQSDEQLNLYHGLTAILSEAVHKTTTDQFSACVASGLRRHFELTSVAFISTRQSTARLTALSPAKKFDRQSELVKSFESVAEEAILQAHADPELDVFSISKLKTEASKSLVSHTSTEHLDCLILRNQDASVNGLCILVGDGTSNGNPTDLYKIACELVGQQHELFYRAKPNLWRRVAIAYGSASRRRWLLNFAIPAIALAILLLIPFPLKVKTNCTVQPKKRRYVAAPYEGRLEQVFVEPGDLVNEGDVLARMDAREIRWELGVVRADYSRARKEWDAAMAPGTRDTSAAQIASFEMERLDLKRKLLEEREANLDIKSPTDGVVISGDPKKLEGARLTMGQTLAEVGPIEDNVFELEIPDEDITHVSVGSEVRIKLDSLPGETLRGRLSLIHPRAEQRADRNIFVGDVESRIETTT